MKKIKNNKGFALVETLIVSMFIVMTFSIIYNSFIPLLGHYEKAEHQDNIDSKYATYWIKRMIQRSGGNIAEIKTTVSSNTYYQFKCSDITMSNPEEQTRLRNMCLNYLEKANVLCGDVNNYKTNEDEKIDKGKYVAHGGNTVCRLCKRGQCTGQKERERNGSTERRRSFCDQ